ncbi:hypothetical protein [Novosphingobium sp. 28-62-57]|uniref:hypothetical protein n=1 Tax=Novosphingobium sp. 28-62-57 TaxID=1970409 RepID=UPI0025CDC3D5|nr:hypothetical protein [Novosphingobium sp. 28-62-57]HQS96696.1 hypothetical protein [Novosphingobium sp.]
MTPIEKAARALCAIDGVDPDSSLGGAGRNFLWQEYAAVNVRAVLEAIREPSVAMAKAGTDAMPAFEAPLQADASDCWQAMINAALSE